MALLIKPWLLLVLTNTVWEAVGKIEIIHEKKVNLPATGTRTYKAAVLEHQPAPMSGEPLDTMLENVHIYRENAALASKQGAKIIVYPEYGLTGLNMETRDDAEQFAQEVPDPKVMQWNPCIDAGKYSENSKVIQELSCIALNNSIVVVANLITRVPCNSRTSSCPKDNHFLFNTNVLFGSNGTLLATYHKHHLFIEPYVDPSPEAEYVIVDLGFVRLGTFICFDIMFGEPSVQLIEKYGIRNIAFPTAWVDTFPHFSSIQTFQSFAYGLGINLLAADLHHPKGGSLGSGIYSSIAGTLNETYDLAFPNKLLISDVPVDPHPVELSKKKKIISAPASQQDNSVSTNTEQSSFSVDYVDVPSSKPVGNIHKVFYTDLSVSNYIFLTNKKGVKTVCYKDICCQVDYSFLNQTNDIYVFIASSDEVGFETKFYVETCTVVRCEKADIKTCGKIPQKRTQTQFEHLVINGNFTTKYLYPNVFSTKLTNIYPSIWKASEKNPNYIGTLGLTKPTEDSILAASIIGRKYDSNTQNEHPGKDISSQILS